MNRFLLISTIIVALLSCERPFTPPVITEVNELVVEGFIEAGPREVFPYVILTRAQPFFSELSNDALNDFFVHDATVTIRDGDQELLLYEVCLEDLPPNLQEQASSLFGFASDSLTVNVCAYLDLNAGMKGQEGHTYELLIEAEGQTLRAETTIPAHNLLDSLRFATPPGETADSLAQLEVYLNDPPGIANFYRYFTGINGGPLLAPAGSVTDDRLFDGQQFNTPLPRAAAPGEAFDLSTFGLYTRGDTVTIKWACLDEPHYDFFNTLEFLRANQGPFSNYSRVSHNIEGGLGIWGGLSASYYTIIVPEN